MKIKFNIACKSDSKKKIFNLFLMSASNVLQFHANFKTFNSIYRCKCKRDFDDVKFFDVFFSSFFHFFSTINVFIFSVIGCVRQENGLKMSNYNIFLSVFILNTLNY